MYFDEELILDVRLNTLNEFVDYFVIVESRFTHSGEERNLQFNHQKFEKFKDKIIYLIYDQQPAGVKSINNKDTEHKISSQYIFNAGHRENGQRNYIAKGLADADADDIILISDVDEIPNLDNINFQNINEKIILFKQNMFYYKFNLHLQKLIWTGTKGCKKRDLLNPQWLRNVKDRKYPFFRLDTFFSKNKYQSIKYINDGGWHFTNLKTAKKIHFKLKSYLHHREFDVNPLTIDQINEIINDKRAIYNLNVDKSETKWGSGDKLEKFEIKKLPIYIQKNLNNFKEWID
jgi:beta-1,4-mannosyl-glycoprotein beta-1,4-N-acetylglucosaminyltransferase